MVVSDWLRTATNQLTAAGIATARLDCLVLLEDATGKDRTWLLAHPEHMLTKDTIALLEKQLSRRQAHEPLAYIRNHTEFYGRDFYVDHRVLEPRPESETMIDLLKQHPLPQSPAIIDVGTGSGALAITAKLELPHATALGIDIDHDCLAVARSNARALRADVHFKQGDLLEPIADEQLERSILLCNLPYVPESFQINPAAMNEPRLAIFSGHDGLDLYRRLFAQLDTRRIKPLCVFTEALPPQHQQLADIARAHNFVLVRTDDFIQTFKTAADSSAS